MSSALSLMKQLRASADLARIGIDDVSAVLRHPGVDTESRLEVMLALTRRKPAEVFWRIFHQTWPACEDRYELRSRLLKILVARDAEGRGISFLDDRVRSEFDALSNPFVAFRGCSKDRVMGLVWTTSEAKAMQYTQELQVTGGACVVIASVPKSAVYGVHIDRNGIDIVINPRRSRLTTRHLSQKETLNQPDGIVIKLHPGDSEILELTDVVQ